MVDITCKNSTHRIAVAEATLQLSKQETLDAINERRVPKGDIFEFARAAGMLAVKKTSDMIPDCHPLPIEYTSISFSIEKLEVHIRVEVHTIYKTGVEVEAMHGASVAALVMYDMLKPIDRNVEIGKIFLREKRGGKSDRIIDRTTVLKTGIIVCSDSVSEGKAIDTAGQALITLLKSIGISYDYIVTVPDDIDAIRNQINMLSQENYSLVICCGGTGLSPRDVTPEAVLPLLDITIPGIMEAARSFGQHRLNTAMLSRGVAGFLGNMLVLTFPGSERAVHEYFNALFPHVLHVFDIKKGAKH